MVVDRSAVEGVWLAVATVGASFAMAGVVLIVADVVGSFSADVGKPDVHSE